MTETEEALYMLVSRDAYDKMLMTPEEYRRLQQNKRLAATYVPRLIARLARTTAQYKRP